MTLPRITLSEQGYGTFEDASHASGYALNESGRETASMGIAIGDYTHNGLLDLYNTTFSDDYNPLYRNDKDANFTDIAYEAGIAEVTIPFLGWGTSFFDYETTAGSISRCERAYLSCRRRQPSGHTWPSVPALS